MTATTVFMIKNQAGHFLSKQNEWVDTAQPSALYRTVHRDEAVNTVFEVSAKDIYLRAEVIACRVDEKGQPLLDSAAGLSAAQYPAESEAVGKAATDLTFVEDVASATA